MAPSLTTSLRIQLTPASRELAPDGVRPRVAAARGARLPATRRAGCGAKAEAQAGAFHAPHAGPVLHVASGQTQALRVPVRAQSTLAVTEPVAGAASAEARMESAPPDVRVVENRADAEDVVRRLMSLEDDGYPVYHAVDTEVLPAASRLLRHDRA